jgi:hypothetical protein
MVNPTGRFVVIIFDVLPIAVYKFAVNIMIILTFYLKVLAPWTFSAIKRFIFFPTFFKKGLFHCRVDAKIKHFIAGF